MGALVGALRLSTAGCGGNGATTIHPMIDSLSTAQRIPSRSPTTALLALRDALRSARQDWVVGTLGGASETVFGHVTSIAVDGANVFVLDGMANEIRVFDTTRAFRQRIGRRGRGPGEFEHVRRLDVLRGQLTVAMASGLTTFALQDSAVTPIAHRKVGTQMPSPA